MQFLTTFTVSLMKALDIRSEPAVRLLSEFLDLDADRGHEHDNAEHFAHGKFITPGCPWLYDAAMRHCEASPVGMYS